MAPSLEGMRSASGTDRFDIQAVENALADLWLTHDPSGTNEDTVRACAVNFVIPIKAGSYAQWQGQLAELSCLVPSRILIIEEAPDGSRPAIHAHVNASCHRRRDGTLTCSEIVHVAAVADACKRLPSICRALAVSDLPVVYLALDRGTLDPTALQSLIEPSDLIIVDTGRREQGDHAADLVFCDGDLAWPRLVPWRYALGNFLRSHIEFPIDQVRSVRIRGASSAGPLMAGWICYLLRWRTPGTRQEGSGITTATGQPVKFELQTTDAGIGGIAEVELEFGTGEGDRAVFTSTGDQDCKIVARVGNRRIETHRRIKRLSLAEEVAHIIHSSGADQNYVRVMQFAHAIPG